MLKLDALSQLKQLKSDIKASRNLMVGTVKGTGNKFGFVTLDAGKDIFLPPDEMLKVLPGDRVEVEVKKEPKSKTFALIERLIESPTKIFFGKYVTKGSAHFVEADISGLSRWIFIPPAKRKSAQTKDFVKCRLTQHPIKSGKAQAAVIDVIGNEQEQGVEWKYSMLKYDIRQEWSAEINAQLEGVDDDLITQLSKDREDLTGLSFVTIDAPNTQDLDDALWVESTPEGWLLRVAIADPASLIEKNSPIEKELLIRGNSVYFPGQLVPMLPPKISSDLGSLREGQRRLAKVIELTVTRDGELQDGRILNAVISVSKKLSYQDVALVLDDSACDDDLSKQVRLLDEVSSALASWRANHALLHPSRTDFYIELNDKQKIASIKPKLNSKANRVVEECMVVANRYIADLLSRHDVDSIFIEHAGIREERHEAITKVLQEHAPEHAQLDLRALPDYQACLKALQDKESYHPLYSLISKQLTKSVLSGRAQKHFGMALKAYTTFTSPLRKSSDFLLHRQIDALLHGQEIAPIKTNTRDNIEAKLQSARGAAYDVEQWLKCQYMVKNKEVLSARVVRVYASGCQVRIDDTGIEGFLSAKELEGKYSFNQVMMTLKGKDFQFSLDQAVIVKLKNIDWARKQMQFVPISDENPDAT